MTLVDDKSLGMRTSVMLVGDKPQGIRTSVTLVNDKPQRIRTSVVACFGIHAKHARTQLF